MTGGPRLPKDLQGRRIVRFTRQGAESWAWVLWLEKYKKQPGAPTFKTVGECVRYVMRIWKDELQG